MKKYQINILTLAGEILLICGLVFFLHLLRLKFEPEPRLPIPQAVEQPETKPEPRRGIVDAQANERGNQSKAKPRKVKMKRKHVSQYDNTLVVPTFGELR